MPLVTQFCVGLNNVPGTLAKLCSALRKARINIDAISVADNAECSWVRFVGSPAAKAKRVLKRGRYHFSSHRALCVPVANRPGELERIATKLGKAGVNIHYVYGSNPAANKGTLVLAANDLARAKHAVGR
jgi:hypothetical protein